MNKNGKAAEISKRQRAILSRPVMDFAALEAASEKRWRKSLLELERARNNRRAG